LQDFPDTESWAFLDKLICHWRIAEEKVRAQCGLPAATPYGRCQLFRNQQPTPEWLAEQAGQVFDKEATKNPYFNITQITTEAGSKLPTPPPTTLEPHAAPAPVTPMPVAPVPVLVADPAPVSIVTNVPVTEIPQIQCDAWNINFQRVCSSEESCCGSVRSDTAYCWGIYDQLGDGMEAACFRCCDPPQTVGPMAPVLDDLPLTIQCAELENIPNRMCKQDSCCSDPRSGSDYCKDQYNTFSNDELKQICHYCCATPMNIGPDNNNRHLRRASDDNQNNKKTTTNTLEGAKEFNVYGKKFLLSKENFEPMLEDEQEYFDRRYAEHKRRNMQGVHLENYENIEWDPYEWLFRVETEYYFRYEGTMVIPPCWEVVHWRNMKDPIAVHKRQIEELNRLLAWRNNPTTCARETSGIVSPDGSHIIGRREEQYMHDQHRFVFCECIDWPSKFKRDREWCHRYKEDTNYTRFYDRPYSFNTNGQWLPSP
jgi:Eukaryotic-type carbonic anhydrase